MRDRNAEAAEIRLNRLMNLILESAVETLDFDAASVSARHAGEYSTVAVTDQRFTHVDEAQYDARSGPCLEVMDDPEPILLTDAAADQRWERFAEAAADMGVVNSLSIHIPTDAEDLASSLNLYARRQMDVSDKTIRAAQSVADQLAAAIHSVETFRATARLAADMAEAMRTRAVIEQAKGILIAERGIGPDDAFDILRELSQTTNVKLREVAARLVAARAGASRTT
jgi:GAF domain-containing protein